MPWFVIREGFMLLTNQLGKIRSNPDKTKTKCFIFHCFSHRGSETKTFGNLVWRTKPRFFPHAEQMLRAHPHPGPLHPNLPPRGGSQS